MPPYVSCLTDANLLRMVIKMGENCSKGLQNNFSKARVLQTHKRQFPLELLQQNISGKDQQIDYR